MIDLHMNLVRELKHTVNDHVLECSYLLHRNTSLRVFTYRMFLTELLYDCLPFLY